MSAPSMWRRSALWFALALLVQLAMLGGMVAAQQVTTEHGKAVYLKVEPVDPRDPLRGDYLTFRYSISHVSYDMIGDPMVGMDASTPELYNQKVAAAAERGAVIWVPLGPSGAGLSDVQYGARIAPRKPETGVDAAYAPSTLFIKGSVESTDTTGVNVVYGIEEYFVPEGEAAKWPRTGTPDAKARVLVDPDTGKAQLNQIFLFGKPWP